MKQIFDQIKLYYTESNTVTSKLFIQIQLHKSEWWQYVLKDSGISSFVNLNVFLFGQFSRRKLVWSLGGTDEIAQVREKWLTVKCTKAHWKVLQPSFEELSFHLLRMSLHSIFLPIKVLVTSRHSIKRNQQILINRLVKHVISLDKQYACINRTPSITDSRLINFRNLHYAWLRAGMVKWTE